MDSVNPTPARESYDTPSLTPVGTVVELTAGPVTDIGESSGGFHTDKRMKRPQIEDID